MYSICKTNLPASTVEHSIYCHFYNSRKLNLVVAGANRITVYRIVRFLAPQATPNENNINNNVTSNSTIINNKNGPEHENDLYNVSPAEIKQEHDAQVNGKLCDANNDNSKQNLIQNIKLECLQTFELYGTVASLQKVRIGSSMSRKRDSLVISFHDAKLSIVEYDPETHDLKTLSMHYFEDEILRDGYVSNHINPPIVRIDPEDRCAAMLIYGKHIVIIPLNRDITEDLDPGSDAKSALNATAMSLLDESRASRLHSSTLSYLDQSIRPPSPVAFANHIEQPQVRQAVALTPAVTPSFRSPVLPSYKVDLSEETCGEKINNIVDIQFLHNYNDPTLVILYEPVKTWSGRVATRQDTFSMVFLSMNIHQRLQPIIWKVDKLPYDCVKILPVPKPIGGLLIIAVNELIYINQSVEPYGVTFNCFTKDSSDFRLNDQFNLGTNDYINVSLDLSEAIFLTSNKILFVLKDGEIYLVTLFNDDMRCIKGFQFEKVASTVQPSTLTLCENNLIFVGSHVGDSVLLECIEKQISDETSRKDPTSKGHVKRPFVYEHDKLISCSASGRVCYGEATNVPDILSHESKSPFVELITTAGFDKNGSICAFQRTIKPQIQDTYDLKDCSDIWTIKLSASAYNELRKEYELKLADYESELASLLAATNGRSEAKDQNASRDDNVESNNGRNGTEKSADQEDGRKSSNGNPTPISRHNHQSLESDSDTSSRQNEREEPDFQPLLPPPPPKPSPDDHSYMVISRDNSTRIFKIGDDFDELTSGDCEFEVNVPTLLAGNIGNENLIIQVTARGVHLLEGYSVDKVRRLNFVALDGQICDATICDHHIIALAKNGSIFHLELKIDVCDSKNSKYFFSCREFPGLDRTKIVSLSMLRDVSGVLKVSTKEDQEATFRRDFSTNDELAVENNFYGESNGIMPVVMEDDDIYGNSCGDSSDYHDDESNDSLPQPNKKFCPEPKISIEPTTIKNKISEIISGNLDDDDIYGVDDCLDHELDPEPVQVQAQIKDEEPVTESENVNQVIIKSEPIYPDEEQQKTNMETETIDVGKTTITEPNTDTNMDEQSAGDKSPIEQIKQLKKNQQQAQTIKNEPKPDFSNELGDLGRYTKFTELKQHTPTYWLFLVDDRGVLEIYSVPSFSLVYLSKNLPQAPRVLLDNLQYFESDADLDARLPQTKEILVTGMGHNGHKPTIFLRFDNELIVYEAYSYVDTLVENHLNIRFKKIETILLSTIDPSTGDASTTVAPDQDSVVAEPTAPASKSKSSRSSRHHHRSRKSSSSHHHHNHQLTKEKFRERRHWLKPVCNIGGYNGVFLIGHRPHWLLMSHQGVLRSHPMPVDGSIYCFADYKTLANNESGFMYFTENRELRIARLPQHLNLDYHWPVRKINIGATTHFVNYHVDRKVYSVVASQPVPCMKLMKVGNEPDTMKVELIERQDVYIPATTEQFKLELYDPENWDLVPDCEVVFDEWEQVTCVKNVMLASEGTTSGLKGYIAISTNYCYGEDVANRGRIWILDLIEVVPEPGRPLTKNKIKTVYCQEQKGPVTTLTHTCGLLLSAVGQKIYLWQLKEEQLDGIAFIDTQIYIHCASSVKNLILVSDIYKSVSLLRYQQGTRTLSMICRDTKPLEVFACDFAIDNELLNFVVTDSEKNIIIYTHDPEHRDSHGGTRLLRRADYHLGAHVNSMCRIRARVPAALAGDPVEVAAFKRRHVTLLLTVDGGFGFLMPINEIVYRRLLMLQNEMTIALPHVAGLNPKAWRLVKHFRKSLANPCKLVLDGDFIQTFLQLSQTERIDVTRKIGTTVDKILADLQHIYEATLHF